MTTTVVRIRHPDVAGAAFVTERAYQLVWKLRSWRRRLPADDDDDQRPAPVSVLLPVAVPSPAPPVDPVIDLVGAVAVAPPVDPASDTPIGDALLAGLPVPYLPAPTQEF